MPREIPYRGDGISRNVKPLRRFVNLKRERRGILISVLIVIMFSAIIFGSMLLDPNANNGTKTVVVVIGSIFALTLIAGILSFNKFRKGYDVDISEQAEIEKSNKSEDSKD